MRNAWTGLLPMLALGAGLSAGSPARADGVGPYYATPSWDQTLACVSPANCPRFMVLSNMKGEAVLDRETGLVWQRTPDPFAAPVSWADAFGTCHARRTGGRMGWRLPSISELASLADENVYLPVAGSPFIVEGLANVRYWSSTTDANDPQAALTVGTFIKPSLQSLPKTWPFVSTWCVRGGQGTPP